METALNDTVFLNALKKGDQKAFEKVYHSYFRQLCSFAEEIVGNRHVSEDIVIDSFVKLFQKRPDFTNTFKLKSFLFTLVHNASLNYIKAAKRHAISNKEIGYLQQYQENSQRALIHSEIMQAIYSEIENLPQQCRQIVKLSFIEGKSTINIAKEMNLAYQTVQNQKTRGVRLLRIALIRNKLMPILILSLLAFFTGR